MKLSISNIAWNNEFDSAVFSYMKEYGFTGLEIAPTKIFPSDPYGKIAEAERYAQELFRENGFSLSSIQSIWYGRGENMFSSDAERELLFDYTRRAIDFASAIGARNLVFGCPRNRSIGEGKDSGGAVEFFRALGNYAYSKNTVIGMEANPKIYNTNYINETEEAISLIKSVNSDGFKLNFDFGAAIHNGESLDAIKQNAELINHVHISEPMLAEIKPRDAHKELAEILRETDYVGFVSIEMGNQSDILVIRDAMRYVSEVFS